MYWCLPYCLPWPGSVLHRVDQAGEPVDEEPSGLSDSIEEASVFVSLPLLPCDSFLFLSFHLFSLCMDNIISLAPSLPPTSLPPLPLPRIVQVGTVSLPRQGDTRLFSMWTRSVLLASAFEGARSTAWGCTYHSECAVITPGLCGQYSLCVCPK